MHIKNIEKKKKLIFIFFILTILIFFIVIIFSYFSNLKNRNINTYNKNFEIKENLKTKDEVKPVLSNKNKNNNSDLDTEEFKNSSSNSSKKISETNFSNWNNYCDKILIVVNKDNPISTNYNAEIIDYKNIKINAVIKNDLDNMINEAAKKGLKIYPSSGYRSIDRQTTLFNKQVSKYKKQGYKDTNAETMAAKVVAKPKTSEHHTGLAIDFNGVRDDFYKTKEYKWLIKNAANYGFILRYPKNKTEITNVIYEPWHFRYIGIEHAKKMAQTDLCYEEYIKSIIEK